MPPRKPMRSARKVSLFEREIRIRLGRAAIELLFASAQVLSEGQAQGERYFGSTMLTMDLARMSAQLSEACDVATARKAEALLARDPRIQERARSIAIAEAERLAGEELGAFLVDIKIRRSGRHFFIDIDVEADVGLGAHAVEWSAS